MKRFFSNKMWTFAFMAILLGSGLTRTAPAQDLSKVGHQLTERYQEAVITIKVVLSIQRSFGGGQSNSIKGETLGTIISPDGLVVVPLYALDPPQLINQLSGMQMESNPIINSQVKDIKLLLGRQKEVPATVVLRDKDQGIAFLRPIEKPKEKLVYIDLKSTAQPQPLDQIIIMTRLGNAADRQIGLLQGAIQAVISKPRKYFVPSGGFGGFGIPAFSVKGNLLGIFMLRVTMGGQQDIQSGIFSLNLSHMGVLPIILPAAELQKLAVQAPEKPEKTAPPIPALKRQNGNSSPTKTARPKGKP